MSFGPAINDTAQQIKSQLINIILNEGLRNGYESLEVVWVDCGYWTSPG